MRPDWPELSDLIVDTDPETLARRPVPRKALLETLDRHGMRTARKIVERMPGGDTLDPHAVDGVLTRAHSDLQRLSFEFRNGERLLQMLGPLVEVLRTSIDTRPIRIVDIGCGMGFVLRWLAAHARFDDDVELLGCDFNPELIRIAQALAREENLNCDFRVANAFTLEHHAHVFISTGVLHHFRDGRLDRFFSEQARAGAAAMLHCDIKASWAAPLGAWLFHQARMREPLARHDGVLSAVRAHPRQRLVEVATRAGRPLRYALYDGHWSPLPLMRTMNTVVGLRASLVAPFRQGLGRADARLGEFA